MPKNIERRKGKPGQVFRMEGQRYGSLQIVDRAGFNEAGYVLWRCACDCGEQIVVSGDRLRRGNKKTCGVNGHRFREDRPIPITLQFPSEYQSWHNMRQRCQNPRHVKYPNYGGRGITIDPRWNKFKTFMLDMGRKPHPRHTIEREDVNGNYEPKNCRWIARKDQGRNKRNSIFVTYQGKRMLLIDLVEDLGLSRGIVYGRLKAGWTLAQAIALPVKPYNKK